MTTSTGLQMQTFSNGSRSHPPFGIVNPILALWEAGVIVVRGCPRVRVDRFCGVTAPNVKGPAAVGS